MRLIIVLIMMLVMIFQPVQPRAAAQGLVRDITWNEEKREQVTQYVNDQLKQHDVIGGAFGVVYQDQLLHSGGFGAADHKQHTVPAQDTIYFMASITKVFTAEVILQLHEAGRLDIDQPVQQYIPWFKLRDKESTSKLTLRHLLSHAAGGISSMQTDGLVFKQKGAKDSLEMYVRQFEHLTLSEEPGQTASYCNGCYDVLGYVIEAVTGESYYDYMQKHLYEPLGMNDTGYGKDLGRFPKERIAKEYSWFFTGKLHLKRSYEEFGAAQDPDGGAYSTIEDLGKYISYQLGYAEHPLLHSVDKLEKYRENDVINETGDAYYTASGFEAIKLGETRAYFKSGDGVGSSSVIFFVPEYELGIALVLGEMNSGLQIRIAQEIAKIVMGLSPDVVPEALAAGKLIGIIAIFLVIMSIVLAILLIRIYRKGLRNKRRSRLRISLSLLSWGMLSAFFWWLVLGFRPVAMGWFGYPYDLSIGLLMMTGMSSLFLCYNIVVSLAQHNHWFARKVLHQD